MIKEAETEETIVFFVTFLSLVAFQLGGGGVGPHGPPLWLRLWYRRYFFKLHSIFKKSIRDFQFFVITYQLKIYLFLFGIELMNF